MRLLYTLLGLGFAAAGAGKLADQHGYRQLFRRWGWSTREMQLVGLAEIAGGFLVAQPSTRKLGGALLAATSGTVLNAEMRHSDGDLGTARAALLIAALTALLPTAKGGRARTRLVR